MHLRPGTVHEGYICWRMNEQRRPQLRWNETQTSSRPSSLHQQRRQFWTASASGAARLVAFARGSTTFWGQCSGHMSWARVNPNPNLFFGGNSHFEEVRRC